MSKELGIVTRASGSSRIASSASFLPRPSIVTGRVYCAPWVAALLAQASSRWGLVRPLSPRLGNANPHLSARYRGHPVKMPRIGIISKDVPRTRLCRRLFTRLGNECESLQARASPPTRHRSTRCRNPYLSLGKGTSTPIFGSKT